jgi:hypothetical protein
VRYVRLIATALVAMASAFLALSLWFAYVDRFVPSLLALTSGLISLSSALALIKEYPETCGRS